MQIKRGGTRKVIIHPQASPISATTSPDSSVDNPNPLSSLYGRYPDTQSGRGHARFQGTEGRDAAVH